MKIVKILAIALIACGAMAVGFVFSGAYNMGADQPHSAAVLRALEALREHSIKAHSANIVPPKLHDPALITEGAEHYSAMCTGCHLAPGVDVSELRPGLYPQPPILARRHSPDPVRDFWIIKHGIKMSGMPAWGATHDDEAIWGMVALLRELPSLSPEAYQHLVTKSGSDDDEHDDHAEAHEHTHEHQNSEADAPANVPASAVEPAATVDRFFQSLSAGDTKGATALLDPKVLIFESGGAERSRQEYMAQHMSSDVEFLRSAKQHTLSRSGDTIADMAWIATTARVTAPSHGKPINLQTTETMILRKTIAGWRIVHIHWSNQAVTI